MKKKILYTLTALMAVTATSCKDDEIVGVGSAADLDRMPRTMFCTTESTGEDKDTNVHCITEDLNTIYLSWFKIDGAAGYHIRYSGNTAVRSGEMSDWDQYRDREIYIGENVTDVLDPNIVAQAKVIDHINELTDLKNLIGDDDEYVIVKQDLNEFHVYNLEYKHDYRFAIRTLSPRGEEHHSEWWGVGNQQHWGEYCGQETEARYETPEVVKYVSKDKHSINIYINLRTKDAMDGMDATYTDSYKQNFSWSADSTFFEADMLQVTPDVMTPNASIDEKWKTGVPLSELNVVNGYADITIDGLDENTVYVINLLNSNVPVKVDACYNTLSLRTAGERNAPIVIGHSADTIAADTNLVAAEYNAVRIDTILSSFMNDNTLPEGQVFYLRGGKTYYFASSVSMYKGFTLETLPSDVEQGKRATVYMGGLISKKGNRDVGTVGQLVLGRTANPGEADAPLMIEKIMFNNLDVIAPDAKNVGSGSPTGNYFVNMLSNGMGITFDAFEVHNCTFQNLIRGFFRLQGTKVKVFGRCIVDNCVFYNCGYYATNGNSYAMFAGDGKSPKSNPWTDFQFTNNTIYDSPWVHIFLPDNNANLSYPEYIKWNIRIENNTFINFNTCAGGRYIFNSRYVPSGSYISFKNNLIALAKDERDIRNINNQFGDIRTINGSTNGTPQITLDVENNYSVGFEDSHLKDDGIWTAQAPSATKNSFGVFWNATPGLLQSGADHSLGSDALKTLVGKRALLSTELFKNPNPPFYASDPAVADTRDHIAPDNIWDALLISPSGTCPADHEILVKKIGAPRWYTNDPEHYTIPVE